MAYGLVVSFWSFNSTVWCLNPAHNVILFLEFNKSSVSARISKVAPSILPVVIVLEKLIVTFARRVKHDRCLTPTIYLKQ